jgi:hypothetical protein
MNLNEKVMTIMIILSNIYLMYVVGLFEVIEIRASIVF